MLKSIPTTIVFILLASVLHAQVIDQEQNVNNACMAGFGQVDLAQSFQPSFDNVAGAGIFMSVGVGTPESMTLELWDALPNQGGTLLASGTILGNPGTWVDVFWPSVSVTANTTYYIVFSTVISMCYAGDVTDSYPRGQVYANSGFGSFPGFDYTFRTYSNDKPSLSVSPPQAGGFMNIEISSLSAGAEIVLVMSSLGPGPTVTPFGDIDVTAPFRLSPRFPETAGAFSWTSTVPAGASGQTFYMQAVEFEPGGETELSNSIAVLVN